jgi:DNA replication protein DnaC
VSALNNQLKQNADLPKESQRSARDIKEGFIKRVLEEHEHRQRQFDLVDVTSPSEHLPAKFLLLDLTCLDPIWRAPFHEESFPEEPYLLIHADYKEVMDLLRSRHSGERGSVFLTGQPGIGKSYY